MKCGAPYGRDLPKCTDKVEFVIDDADHVAGLKYGGFAVTDGHIKLCNRHCSIVMTTMADRGVTIAPMMVNQAWQRTNN